MDQRQDPRGDGPEGAFFDDPLSHALYIAARTSAALYRPRLARLGLTFPQYLVLQVLWEEGAATSQDLADALRLDSGTLSPLLKRMEQAGLVSRRRAPRDERLVEVIVAPAGDALRGPAALVAQEVRRERVTSSPTYENLVRSLYEMADHVPSEEIPDAAAQVGRPRAPDGTSEASVPTGRARPSLRETASGPGLGRLR